MTDKLIPIGDLGKLTEAEKTKYYIQVCEYFDLPAELNLLEFIWMDSGDAGRKLVLYAKKGATDRLRDLRGIHVTELTHAAGDGYIMFTATGKDNKGRTEIAVGAHETRGLAGKTLADAIAIAQTKAVRRMTLQFVGGGFLDESELSSGTTRDLATAPVMLSQLASQPTSTPNASKGVDITDGKPETGISLPMGGDLEVVLDKQEVRKGIVNPNLSAVSIGVEGTLKRRKRSSGIDLSIPVVAPKFDLSEPFVPSDAPKTMSELAKEITDPDVLKTAEETGKAAAEELNKMIERLPVVPVEYIETPEERATRPAVIEGLPSVPEMKEFRARLFKYTEEILPRGGMVPSVGIGGINAKLKAYAKAIFPGVEEFRHMTAVQWDGFLGGMDETVKNSGEKHLVEAINKMIGATE